MGVSARVSRDSSATRATETVPVGSGGSHFPLRLPQDHYVSGSSAPQPTSSNFLVQRSSLTARLSHTLAMASSPSLGCLRPRFVPRESPPRNCAMWTPQVRPVGRTAGFVGASGDSHAAQHILPSSLSPGRRVSQEHVRECRLGICGGLPAVRRLALFPRLSLMSGLALAELLSRREVPNLTRVAMTSLFMSLPRESRQRLA